MRLFRRTVIINTKSDKAFRGVLWSRWFGVWVLKNAQLLQKGQAIDIDGEVVILKQDIDFIQVVPL
jgi:hypothetical protein